MGRAAWRVGGLDGAEFPPRLRRFGGRRGPRPIALTPLSERQWRREGAGAPLTCPRFMVKSPPTAFSQAGVATRPSRGEGRARPGLVTRAKCWARCSALAASETPAAWAVDLRPEHAPARGSVAAGPSRPAKRLGEAPRPRGEWKAGPPTRHRPAYAPPAEPARAPARP